MQNIVIPIVSIVLTILGFFYHVLVLEISYKLLLGPIPALPDSLPYGYFLAALLFSSIFFPNINWKELEDNDSKSQDEKEKDMLTKPLIRIVIYTVGLIMTFFYSFFIH